jgi:hypothetical protein
MLRPAKPSTAGNSVSRCRQHTEHGEHHRDRRAPHVLDADDAEAEQRHHHGATGEQHGTPRRGHRLERDGGLRVRAPSASALWYRVTMNSA